MARFRSSIHPVNRIKHVVDAAATLAAAVNLPTTLIKAVDAPVIANTNEVVTGARVNGIYLKVEVVSNETDVGAIPNFYMAVYKDPGSLIPDFNPGATGDDTNKKFIIHQEMVLMNNVQGGNPRIVFNGVIVIPKRYQRFGPLDELKIIVRSNALNVAFCLQCHYKEFR